MAKASTKTRRGRPLPSRNYWKNIRRCTLSLNNVRLAPLPIASTIAIPIPNAEYFFNGHRKLMDL